MYITYKYRVKDSASCKKLEQMAYSVNFIWNYCNEWSHQSIINKGKFLSNFDLNELTTGCSKYLKLNSHTIRSVCDEYSIRRKQFKRNKLRWRNKKSLGWVPFTSKSIRYITTNTLKYNKKIFKFWESRPIIGEIRCGSFNQDSRGRWYVNLVCKMEDIHLQKTGLEIGVDLGLKTSATYSNGDYFTGEKPTRKYASRLAMAQRANKKKRVSKINAKIANIRRDSLHKETTRLVKNYDLIIVGDVSSTKLVKTKMAKSTLDVSWGAYKTLLEYKTIRFGKELKVVKESWTSKTCSKCFEKSGPSGLSNLSVREWICSACGKTHDRDVNAAKNILRLGYQTPTKGISCVSVR